MNKLNRIIQTLSYDELRAIQKDLSVGNIGRAVDMRLKQIKKTVYITVCPTCGGEHKRDNYVLHFGPSDFRKKAHFCGLDCLEFFILRLKKEQKEKLVKNKG